MPEAPRTGRTDAGHAGHRPGKGSGVVTGSGAGAGGGGGPEDHDDDPVNGGGGGTMPTSPEPSAISDDHAPPIDKVRDAAARTTRD